MSKVSGQGGVYLSGEIAINEDGGPLKMLIGATVLMERDVVQDSPIKLARMAVGSY